MICLFGNRFASASAVTASSEDTSYPGTNIKTPERQLWPYRSLAVGSQNVVVDFGATTSMSYLQLFNVNVNTLTIQGHASDSWGAPTFAQTVTPKQNPITGRYGWGGRLLGSGSVEFNFRYLRFVLNSTPVIAPLTVYQIGGANGHVGIAPPKKFAADWDRIPIYPVTDVSPPHGGWSQRSIDGDISAALTVRRAATYSHATPLVSDDARSWMLTIDKQAFDSAFFGLIEDLGAPELSWMVKQVSASPWRVRLPGVVESQWDLVEVLRP